MFHITNDYGQALIQFEESDVKTFNMIEHFRKNCMVQEIKMKMAQKKSSSEKLKKVKISSLLTTRVQCQFCSTFSGS